MNPSSYKEDIHLLTLYNHLIKGSLELTKKDVSFGTLLPNTGVEVLDSEKKLVFQGRTDDNGQVVFKYLPKGKILIS